MICVGNYFVNCTGEKVTGEPGTMLLMSDNTSTDVSFFFVIFILNECPNCP